ncbi:MAG: hypothetical protein ACRDAL_10950, partial [Plesiomonas shigelloides]
FLPIKAVLFRAAFVFLSSAAFSIHPFPFSLCFAFLLPRVWICALLWRESCLPLSSIYAYNFLFFL